MQRRTESKDGVDGFVVYVAVVVDEDGRQEAMNEEDQKGGKKGWKCLQ